MKTFGIKITSLMLALAFVSAANADNCASTAKPKDIVSVASGAGSFKTLVAAVKAAGLTETLQGSGPFTVFAPTDEAFAKLPKGTVEELLKPENKQKLISILTYHVVPGKILLSAMSPDTVEGRPLAISTSGGFVVNGVKVVAPDIAASNGVIHVIDSVLIPPTKKLSPVAAARDLIELAIERGVPLFNSGQSAACAVVYEVAIESLLKCSGDVVSDRERANLEAALNKMRGEKDSAQQAWTLRRALDAFNESLTTK